KFQASVHAEKEARTEASANQCVVCFAQTDFPGKTCIFDGCERRRPRATVMPAYRNDVRPSFCNSYGNDAHTCAGNELHTDARSRIYSAQIVNQLGEVFDAVNVMMRRRR